MHKINLNVIIVLILALISKTAAADFEYRFNYEGYLTGTTQKYSDSILNPGNEILKIPNQSFAFENRIENKFLINDAKIIIRPNLIFNYASIQTEYDPTTENKSKNILNLTDAFYEQHLTDHLFSTLGLQVYQWGPAEILNPSNPFFHFNTSQREFNYKEKGQILARLNWNTSKETSFVFIAEPISNNESFWISAKEFQPQFLIKFETEWADTRNSLGAIVAKPNDGQFALGEYGQFEIADGHMFYADIKHTFEKTYFKPVDDGTGLIEFQQYQAINQPGTLGVWGYRFEGNFDFRIEYIYNSLGYSDEDLNHALVSSTQILSPYFSDNISRFQKSGLDLMTQNYIYLSVRKSDFLGVEDFTVYLRSLNSLLDYSAVDQFEFDMGFASRWSGFGQIAIYRGEQDTEFKLSNDYKMTVGLKISL